jgi:hypothetical protein
VNVVLAGLYLSLEIIVSAKNAEVTVYGTKKDDSITLKLDGDSSAAVYGGEGNDTITVSGSGGASSDAARGTVTLNGGEGDDLINVDTSLTKNATLANVTGGAGIDRVHLTGTLKQDGTSQAIMIGGVPSITLQDVSEKTIAFLLNSTELYTDALKNKSRVEITKADDRGRHLHREPARLWTTLAAADQPASNDQRYHSR